MTNIGYETTDSTISSIEAEERTRLLLKTSAIISQLSNDVCANIIKKKNNTAKTKILLFSESSLQPNFLTCCFKCTVWVCKVVSLVLFPWVCCQFFILFSVVIPGVATTTFFSFKHNGTQFPSLYYTQIVSTFSQSHSSTGSARPPCPSNQYLLTKEPG